MKIVSKYYIQPQNTDRVNEKTSQKLHLISVTTSNLNFVFEDKFSRIMIVLKKRILKGIYSFFSWKDFI